MSRHAIRRPGTTTTVISLLSATALVGGLLAVNVIANAKSSSTNLLSNPTFNHGTKGWNTWRSGAKLSLAPGRHGSAAKLVVAPGRTRIMLNDQPNVVPKAKAGVTYLATAWVRSDNSNAKVVLRLREGQGREWVGAAHTKVALTSSWQQLQVSYKAKRSTSRVAVHVSVPSASPGDTLYVDDISVSQTLPSDSDGPGPSQSAAPVDPGPADQGAPAGYHLYWSDEFNDTSVNTSRWGIYHNNYGAGNHQLQCFTPDNVNESGGLVTFTGKIQTVSCPGGGQMHYTSGFLGSRAASTPRYYPLFGKYEIRARVPHGQGLAPGFWLRHRDGSSTAEVDVVELFHSQQPGKVTSTLHFPKTLGRNVAKKVTPFETPVQGTGGWHIFAVDIEPAGDNAVQFTFSIDGKTTLTYTNHDASSWTKNPDATWDIAIDMAIGGDWWGDPQSQLGYLPAQNKCSLTYAPPANSDPSSCPTKGIWLSGLGDHDAKYQVDWVRVYTK